MLKRFIFLIIIIFLFKGCTRDDICPEGTATSPKLIIVFKNAEDRNTNKLVEDLSIETDYENSILVLNRIATDSVAIPLNTTSDTTKFRFIRSTGSGINLEANIDHVIFVYSRKDLYVNRACGFKSKFENLQTTRVDEGLENWILDISTIKDTITDEKKAHLTFYH